MSCLVCSLLVSPSIYFFFPSTLLSLDSLLHCFSIVKTFFLLLLLPLLYREVEDKGQGRSIIVGIKTRHSPRKRLRQCRENNGSLSRRLHRPWSLPWWLVLPSVWWWADASHPVKLLNEEHMICSLITPWSMGKHRGLASNQRWAVSFSAREFDSVKDNLCPSSRVNQTNRMLPWIYISSTFSQHSKRDAQRIQRVRVVISNPPLS